MKIYSRIIQLITAIFLICSLLSCKQGDSDSSGLLDDSFPIRHFGPGEVQIDDSFWLKIIERNRKVTIPYVFDKCEETGRVENFAIAAGLAKGSFTGMRYNDSDLFKVLEGACYSLITNPDPSLRRYVDSIAFLISEAQEDDGYLFTARTIDPSAPSLGAGRDRWIDVWVSHELYNAGHLYEAAVAHYLATGNRMLLDCAIKNADLVDSEFGWGKSEAAPGHQEIEIGLVKLYQVTGKQSYLDLAKFFLDVRGKPQEHLVHPPGSRFAVYNDLEYLQQHLPVLEQDRAVGHAVRGAYMYSAMIDISMATGDDSYLEASEKIWRDVVGAKIYLTGGLGSREYGESFGDSFELPNMTAYTETCASVANVFWNDRLFRSLGRSDFCDILETTLYNGLISGISLDGTSFFYPNPLESDGSFSRAGWFDCSCCPVNITRFIASMQKYIYARDDRSLYVNLFISSSLSSGTGNDKISISQKGNYPWSGEVSIEIDDFPPGNQELRIRIPGWTGEEPMPGGLYMFTGGNRGKTVFRLNGKIIEPSTEKGYAIIGPGLKKGDSVSVSFPMDIREVISREEVQADRGKIAFTRGPLLYCFEEADNGKVLVMSLSDELDMQFEFDPNLMEGLGTLVVSDRARGSEYKAIPYFSWCNRGCGEMIVWVEKEEPLK